MPFVNPDQIIVPEGRYRTDFECVSQRAEDIKKVGQLIPILVKREGDQLILLDGECRTRACKLLGRDVWYTTHEDGKLLMDTELQRRLAEHMSNCARQDMNPIDKAKAIADLDRLMKETYGQKVQNDPESEGHASIDTAKMLGFKTRKTVTDAIFIAKAAEAMPELIEAKTTSEAVKMVQTKVRLEAQQELAKRSAGKKQNGPIKDPADFFSHRVILGDCLEGMKKLESGIASIFLTDPIYAIDYKTENLRDDKSAKKNLNKKVLGLYYDLPKDMLPLIEGIIQQIARVGRPNCCTYMFCAYRYWSRLSIIFEENGFQVYNKPITWVRGSLATGKLEPGNCNAPGKWPASNTDCILFAQRGNNLLARQGLQDVIICPSAAPNSKIHSLQRPIPLLVELISRVFHPETKGLLIDPFAGSGSSLAAAMRFEGLSYFGYELDPANRERAISYLINEYNKMINPQPETTVDVDVEDLEV